MNQIAIPETAYDEDRANAFQERVIDILNSAASCLMMSIGHRTGLFDSMAEGGPGTSTQIAEKAGLNERYVREWLGALVSAGIVELDPSTGVYSLPREHADFLTRKGQANLAVFTQHIPGLGAVEDDIIHCFRHGGGVPYHRYTRFHEVMAEDSEQTVVLALEEHILPIIPGLIEQLDRGIEVLDVGCGRGLALMRMAARFPASRFTGYDLSDEAVGWAQEKARQDGLANLTFEIRDLSDFDTTAPEAAFDFITTFDAIHDQAKPLNVLKGIRRALKDDGVYLAQDINGSSHHHGDRDHPLGPLLYTVSCMHCMSVSLAQGGEGLGAMWGREVAERYFGDAGFGTVEVNTLPHDIQNFFYVCRI